MSTVSFLLCAAGGSWTGCCSGKKSGNQLNMFGEWVGGYVERCTSLYKTASNVPANPSNWHDGDLSSGEGGKGERACVSFYDHSPF